MDVDIAALEIFILTQPLQTNDTAAIPLGDVPPDSPLPGLDPAQPGPTFPKLHRDAIPPPLFQLVQYYQSLIHLTKLKEQFKGYEKLYSFTSPVSDPGLKKVPSVDSQVRAFITAAETHLGLAVDPLLHLFSTSGDQRVADVTLALMQGISQLDYCRRLVVLSNQ